MTSAPGGPCVPDHSKFVETVDSNCIIVKKVFYYSYFQNELRKINFILIRHFFFVFVRGTKPFWPAK
jgi:hypothetical protein